MNVWMWEKKAHEKREKEQEKKILKNSMEKANLSVFVMEADYYYPFE